MAANDHPDQQQSQAGVQTQKWLYAVACVAAMIGLLAWSKRSQTVALEQGHVACEARREDRAAAVHASRAPPPRDAGTSGTVALGGSDAGPSADWAPPTSSRLAAIQGLKVPAEAPTPAPRRPRGRLSAAGPGLVCWRLPWARVPPR